MTFVNRVDAGRRLGERLEHLRGEAIVVLGLPRGGVPVASEVARALDAPLDVIVVRKLGVPYQPELGMGAIGEDGVRVINDEVVRLTQVSERRSPRSRPVSARSWNGGSGASAATDPGSRSRGGPRSSSTTASPPGRPPVPHARWHGRTAPPASCSPCPSRLQAGRPDSRQMPTS